MSIEFIERELMLEELDSQGIYASAGSACSSSSTEPSHVLVALGLGGEKACNSLRLTLGRETNEDDIEQVLEVLPQTIDKVRTMSELLEGLARGCCG